MVSTKSPPTPSANPLAELGLCVACVVKSHRTDTSAKNRFRVPRTKEKLISPPNSTARLSCWWCSRPPRCRLWALFRPQCTPRPPVVRSSTARGPCAAAEPPRCANAGHLACASRDTHNGRQCGAHAKRADADAAPGTCGSTRRRQFRQRSSWGCCMGQKPEARGGWISKPGIEGRGGPCETRKQKEEHRPAEQTTQLRYRRVTASWGRQMKQPQPDRSTAKPGCAALFHRHKPNGRRKLHGDQMTREITRRRAKQTNSNRHAGCSAPKSRQVHRREHNHRARCVLLRGSPSYFELEA